MSTGEIYPIPINFGDPDPRHVIGRQELLFEMRRYLDNGSSLLLTAGRRQGKSWTVKTLVATAPEGWTAIYLDVEQLRSVDELVRTLASRLRATLPAMDQAVDALMSIETEVSARGVTATHPAATSAERLARIMLGLAQSGVRLLIALDELPIMVRTIAEDDPAEALHLLRTLRGLRHERSNVRIVCAGSIGFHHVRHDEVEMGAAINDLQAIPVRPLALADAVRLARCLLMGIGIETQQDDPVAIAIADATDGVPFYAHKLVDALDQRHRAGLPINAEAVWDSRVAAISRTGGDPWELDDHPKRVARDFGGHATLALGTLDALAREATGSLAFDELLDRVRVDPEVSAAHPTVARSELLSVVHRLRRDNDIELSVDGALAFTSGVARDAWRATRFLA